MTYTLMHKNIPVVSFSMHEKTCYIDSIVDVFNIRHLPIGIFFNENTINVDSFNGWWSKRSIPASRQNIKSALDKLNIQNTTELLSKCYGLSLSDQYWVCPDNLDLKWDSINFYENDFSKDVGELLFGNYTDKSDKVDLLSPDNTSDGVLKKKWIILDGKRVLMKGSDFPFFQEPYNEKISSSLMSRLNIPYVSYSLTFNEEEPCSLCENFTTPDTEYVSAHNLYACFNKDVKVSKLDNLINCCSRYNIADVRSSLEKMIIIDYIILNSDRHWGNFGFIRNSNTLEFIGFSPIFDNGASLWHKDPRFGTPVSSRAFEPTHEEEVALVKDLSWFDFSTLSDFREEIIDTFSSSKFTEQSRVVYIADSILDRCKYINSLLP